VARQQIRTEITGKDRTKQAIRSARGGLDSLAKKAAVVTGALSSITLLSGGFTKLTASIRASVDRLDSLGKAARRASIDVEELQALRLFGELGGIDSGQIDKALYQLTVRAGEAARGLSTYKRAFEELGVTLKQEDGRLRAPADLFRDTIDALRGMQDEANRSALAYNTLGRQGGAIAQVFFDAGKSVDEVVQHFREMGILLDDVLVQAGEKTKDSFTILGAAMDTLKDTALSRLTIALGELADGFAEAAGEATTWLRLNTEAVQSTETFSAALDKQIAALENSANFDLIRGRNVGARGTGDTELKRLKLAREYLDVRTEELEKIIEIGTAEAATANASGRNKREVLTLEAKVARQVLRIRRDTVEAEKAINAQAGDRVRTNLDNQVAAYEALQAQLVLEQKELDSIADKESIRYKLGLGIVEGLKTQLDNMLRIKDAAEAIAKAEADALKNRSTRGAMESARAKGEDIGLEQQARILRFEQDQARAASTRQKQVEQMALFQRLGLGEISVEQFNELTRAIWGATEAAKQGGGAWRTFAEDINSALEQAALSGNFDTFGAAVWRALQVALYKATLARPLEGLFGAIGDRLQGFFGGRAAGGPVRAGQWGIVGERGPELFMPAVNGMVLSNAQSAAALGAPSFQINDTFVGVPDGAVLASVRRERRELVKMTQGMLYEKGHLRG